MTSFIQPAQSLGEDIHCLTLTKNFFKDINIEPNKENLLADFSVFEKVPIQYMDQVHGNNIEYIKSISLKPIPQTDALFTDISNCALAVLTADCLPIALSLEDGSKFGLIHAGWKGLLSGVLESFIKCIGNDNLKISAWIGPSISAKNYEVGREVYELFIEKDINSQSSFSQIEDNKWLFDLQMEAKRILELQNIMTENSEMCTYDSENFYSYRKNQTNARLITMIWRA